MHTVQLKQTIKAKITGRMAYIVVSCDSFNILGENQSEEVDDDYDYELIARNNVFSQAPKIDFRYETKPIKVMLYWWVEQCVLILHRECYRTLQLSLR